MNIVLKTTLKNIFGKPFRTFLVVFSIFVCSFVAMFCIDFGKVEKDLIRDSFSKVAGNADLVLTVTAEDLSDLPGDFPRYEAVMMYTFTDYIYSDIEGEPMYATRKDLMVTGVDFDEASAMNIISHYDLEDGQVILTVPAAESMGAAEGDTVTLHDNRQDGHEFVVSQIVEPDSMSLLLNGSNAIITANDARELTCGKPSPMFVMFDVLDNTETEQAQIMLEQTYPNGSVTSYTIDDTTQGMLDQALGLMFMVFAVTFLLVVFITASICERIVGERMSFVGTLRSLGMDSRGTGLILLLENAMYAILGSVPGVIFYVLIRPTIFSSVFTVTDSSGAVVSFDVPALSLLLPFGVIIGALAIECFIPLRAIIRALRVSIRDIIFDNRDTEYKFSRTGIIIGAVTGVLAVVCFFFKTNLFIAASCLIFAVISLAFLYPLLLKLVSRLLSKASEKAENARLALASKETISKKSTVTSGILCATSAAMCIIVFSIAVSMVSLYNKDHYPYDIQVMTTAKPKIFSYINYMDEVTDHEYVYNMIDQFEVNGQTKIGQVYGLPDGGFRLFNGIYDLPESIEQGTICVEKRWAGRNGLDIGDTMTVVFDSQGVFPIEKEFTIVSFFNIDSFESLNNNFVINEDEFRSIYHDMPRLLLINATDPESVASTIRTYSKGYYSTVKTHQELVAEENQSSAQIRSVFIAVIVIALFMTCIGMISNQLIGFEGRKKECAVMLATSMERSTLSGVLFREMFITSAVSSTAGAVIGTVLVSVVKTAVDSNDAIVLPLEINIPMILLMWTAMAAVFALTVLFPVRNLYRMKISEQIKYE